MRDGELEWECRGGGKRSSRCQPPTSMRLRTLVFDTTNITSKQNGNNPQWNDPCHCFSATMHAPTVVIAYERL